MDSRTLHKLVCEDLAHRFGPEKLFADLNFTVEQPGSVCVAGANGSGKSTLLRILVGLLRPARGRVCLMAGERELPVREARRYLGLVAPDLHLYGELTAMENLEFFGRLRGVAVTPEMLMTKLDGVGLADHAHKQSRQLSSGQRQRLKYLVAMLHRPPLLLLDEPTANLDDAGRHFVQEVVDRQRREGILIVATNETEEYAFGDQVVRLGP